MSEAQRPPAPTITEAVVVGSAVRVTGTSEVAGTVTLYDGEIPVSTTTTTIVEDGYAFEFTITEGSFVEAGEHSYSCCVAAGDETSEWSAVVPLTVS